MLITAGFPIPIYSDYVLDSELERVQTELLSAVNLIKFNKHPSWESNTHRLSDYTFSENAIDVYALTHFQKQVEIHVKNYMKSIRLSPEKIDHFEIENSWIAQTMPGEYAHVHTHGHSDLSGVYYIKTNTLDGELFFNSPQKLMSQSYCFAHLEQPMQVIPEVGKIVLFPGWMEHGVRTNNSNNERLSISFNINFKRLGYKDWIKFNS